EGPETLAHDDGRVAVGGDDRGLAGLDVAGRVDAPEPSGSIDGLRYRLAVWTCEGDGRGADGGDSPPVKRHLLEAVLGADGEVAVLGPPEQAAGSGLPLWARSRRPRSLRARFGPRQRAGAEDNGCGNCCCCQF